LLLFLILLPMFILIWVIIFISSIPNLQIFFTQTRIGKNKKEFVIYKFRTMKDNKVTFIGHILRKTGLDEIPQLVNIIMNQMAFVGPRPLTQYDIDRLNWNSDEFDNRWKVKPGITGLAQLCDICDSGLSMKNDLFYVENSCFGLDLKIIAKSLIIPFRGKRKQKITRK